MIDNDKVVTFHYQLSGIDGEPIENSYDGEPVAYLHGHGNILPALERALQGKAEGDEFEVELQARDAYGERDENATQRVPLKHLHETARDRKLRLRPGQIVHVHTAQGPQAVTVIKVGKFAVDVDMNHPMAGRDLRFRIRIEGVRDATSDEVAHGHAHGPGGHHHD